MNSSGTLFRYSLFGESHGPSVGVVIDGVPSGIELSPDDFGDDLARRKTGAKGTSPRTETDVPSILSGLYNGKTTGTPICVIFANSDTRSADYDAFSAVPRPGHADFTSRVRYGGFADPRGSGHFSGRVTLGIVAAGVIAKKIIRFARFDTRIVEAGGEADIDQAVSKALKENDSVGAIIETRIGGMRAGIGEPFFGSVEGEIARAVFAIPGIRGIEFGDGFASSKMRASEHNDPFVSADGTTSKNGAGGVNGGITNGNDILFRAAVKPTSTIGAPQTTLDFSTGEQTTLVCAGRHDACIALRAAVVIECAAACVLADLYRMSLARGTDAGR